MFSQRNRVRANPEYLGTVRYTVVPGGTMNILQSSKGKLAEKRCQGGTKYIYLAKNIRTMKIHKKFAGLQRLSRGAKTSRT